jgi:CheY-like chemotaxis protein
MTVHFPSLAPETLAPPPAPAGPAYDTPPVVEGGAPRILLVDDEAMLQLAFSRFFRACGYEVETAGGVEEAVECVRRTRFALVLCDVCMPGASGVELVGRVTALDPDLGVLMLSELNDAAAATEALQGGACDYLVRPVPLPSCTRPPSARSGGASSRWSGAASSCCCARRWPTPRTSASSTGSPSTASR